MNQTNPDQDNFRKKAVIPILLGMYIMLVFYGFWETADDVNDIRRLNHYKGTISSFKCYETEANRVPNPFLVSLSVSLINEKQINFELPSRPIIHCEDFHDTTSAELSGQEFDAYFTASSIKQLHINGREIINFEERKFDSRFKAIMLWLTPFIVYGIYRLFKKAGFYG